VPLVYFRGVLSRGTVIQECWPGVRERGIVAVNRKARASFVERHRHVMSLPVASRPLGDNVDCLTNVEDGILSECEEYKSEVECLRFCPRFDFLQDSPHGGLGDPGQKPSGVRLPGTLSRRTDIATSKSAEISSSKRIVSYLSSNQRFLFKCCEISTSSCDAIILSAYRRSICRYGTSTVRR